jgi:hypothetical protein
VAFTAAGVEGVPHQAFLRLTSRASRAAAYFAASAAPDGSLLATATAAGLAAQLGPQGGAFSAALVVGDERSMPPADWPFAEVTVAHKPLPDGSQPPAPLTALQAAAAPRPLLQHTHREPERRAPAAVAVLFAAAALAPLGAFFVASGRAGANLKVCENARPPAAHTHTHARKLRPPPSGFLAPRRPLRWAPKNESVHCLCSGR